MKLGPIDLVRERFRWISYGLVVGLLIGLILGWFFHGVISWVIRFGFVALLLVPLVVVFIVWRRLEDRSRREAPIETSAEVVEYRVRRRDE